MASLCLRALLLLAVSVPALAQVNVGAMSPAIVDHFSWIREPLLPADAGFSRFSADAGFAQAQSSVAPPLAPGDPGARPGSDGNTTRLGRGTAEVSVPSPAPRPRAVYHFEVKVENRGPAAIRSVVWDYVFRDPASNQVLKVVRFRSDTKIKPGKTKVLEGYTRQLPVNVANVASLKDSGNSHAGESVELVRILFADDSVWTRRR